MLQTLNRAPTALDASGFGEARPRDDGDDEDYDDGAFARATTGLKRTAIDEKPEAINRALHASTTRTSIAFGRGDCIGRGAAPVVSFRAKAAFRDYERSISGARAASKKEDAASKKTTRQERTIATEPRGRRPADRVAAAATSRRHERDWDGRRVRGGQRTDATEKLRAMIAADDKATAALRTTTTPLERLETRRSRAKVAATRPPMDTYALNPSQGQELRAKVIRSIKEKGGAQAPYYPMGAYVDADPFPFAREPGWEDNHLELFHRHHRELRASDKDVLLGKHIDVRTTFIAEREAKALADEEAARSSGVYWGKDPSKGARRDLHVPRRGGLWERDPADGAVHYPGRIVGSKYEAACSAYATRLLESGRAATATATATTTTTACDDASAARLRQTRDAPQRETSFGGVKTEPVTHRIVFGRTIGYASSGGVASHLGLGLHALDGNGDGDVSTMEIAAARASGGSSTYDVRTASACGLDARKSKPWATGVGRGSASGGPRKSAAS